MSNDIGQTFLSWTDDLPVCWDCGSAFSKNESFCEINEHENEHSLNCRNFYCRLDENICLYGVFDGHYGPEYADFALQRITAEIVLGQLTGKQSDEEVKEVLRQAFISVEKGYLDSIDELLAKRLQYELPPNLNQDELSTQYKKDKDTLEAINKELKVGTSAVVALLYNNKLYIANIGTCRALLCRTDSNSVLRVLQLTVDHDIYNEDEELRLKQLGLNMDKIKQDRVLECTRCIGSYLLKGGYKENQHLASAISEPVIAEPEIHGGIEIDDSCRFLLLMSSGLYKSLQEAKCIEYDQVNRHLAQMAVEQFRVHTSLNAVSQGIVDKTVQMHKELYKLGKAASSGHKDITLLVRNFNYPLKTELPTSSKEIGKPKSICKSELKSETNTKKVEDCSSLIAKPGTNTVKFNPVVESFSNLNNAYYSNSDSYETGTNDFVNGTNASMTNSSTNSDTTQSEMTDSDQKIPSYVDFTEYYELVKRAKLNGDLPNGINFD